MSGRDKPSYDPARSPRWQDGYVDGQADRAALLADPDAKIAGPRPPDPAYRVMYDRGYEAGFQDDD